MMAECMITSFFFDGMRIYLVVAICCVYFTVIGIIDHDGCIGLAQPHPLEPCII